MVTKLVVANSSANYVAYFSDAVPIDDIKKLVDKADVESIAMIASAMVQGENSAVVEKLDAHFAPTNLLRLPQLVDWDEIEKVCQIFQQTVRDKIDASFSLKNSPAAKIKIFGNLMEIIVPRQTGKTRFCSTMKTIGNKVFFAYPETGATPNPYNIVFCSGKIIFCDEMSATFVSQLQDALKRDGDKRPIVWIHT